VNDKLVSRQRLASVAELRGLRVGDTTMHDPAGGYHHLRGNHMLYVMRAGLRLDEVQWVEVAKTMDEFWTAQFDSLRAGETDATFVTGGTESYERAGFHVLSVEPLPMITGPTLTSTGATLKKKDRLAERLVKALVLGVHFARTRQAETERILEALKRKVPELGRVSYNSVVKLEAKPYPDHRGVANAYELCCMKAPEAKEVSPMALWDLHYLRDLDDSGFINQLYQRGA
jgi:hypothetical protein